MTLYYTLQQGFNGIINKAGLPIAIKYLTQAWGSGGSVYDDSVILTQSGAIVWTSGVVLNPLSTGDAFLLEQGKLNNSDKKLYVNGSLLLIGSDLQVKIQIGSPGEQYSILSDGMITHQVAGQTIYKKCYIRRLTGAGSLLGE